MKWEVGSPMPRIGTDLAAAADRERDVSMRASLLIAFVIVVLSACSTPPEPVAIRFGNRSWPKAVRGL